MKNYKSTIFLLLAALMLNTACKKSDYQIEEVELQSPPGNESKFFNSHLSSDSRTQGLLELVKRQNSKTHFVEKVIKKIGYPYWDKALTTSVSGSNKGNSEASITYIPFVRESQNQVNAVLAIKTSEGDTSFRYIGDWQYQNLPHGSLAENSAEGLSLFFMSFDNSVFGHKKFNLTQSSLFGNSDDPKEITFTEGLSSNKLGKSNLQQNCVVGYFCGSPNTANCSGSNGCDYMRGCADNPISCYPLLFCFDVSSPGIGNWYPWGPTTGGGGGSGGGGGGSGGGEEPEECQEEPQGKNSIQQECGPGWTPETNSAGYYYTRLAQLEALIDADPFSFTNPCPFLTQFQWIGQFQVPQSIQNRLSTLRQNYPMWPFNDNFSLQTLNNASGTVLNCDYFPISITDMPKTNGVSWTPQQLLDYFRLNINQFINNSIATFAPYVYAGVDDSQLWQSNDPTGALLHLDMFINGSVVISQYAATASSAQMIASTVRTPLDSRHPISGNRVFGIMPSMANPGTYVFYTTAVDRVTTEFNSLMNNLGELLPIVPSGFDSADNLWRSLQTNMTQFVINNGGQAGPTPGVSEITYRPPWLLWDAFLKGTITLEQLKAALGC